MNIALKTAALVALTLAPLAAWSSGIVGNPNLSIVAVGSGSTYIDNVVAKPCNAVSQTLRVKDTLSSANAIDLDLGEDTWCYLYLNVEWSVGDPVTTVQVGGFTSYETLDGEDDYEIEVDSSSETATLVVTGKS